MIVKMWTLERRWTVSVCILLVFSVNREVFTMYKMNWFVMSTKTVFRSMEKEMKVVTNLVFDGPVQHYYKTKKNGNTSK